MRSITVEIPTKFCSTIKNNNTHRGLHIGDESVIYDYLDVVADADWWSYFSAVTVGFPATVT